MKKAIITTALTAAVAGSAMAQGTVTFISSAALRPMQFSATGQAAGDTKVPIGSPAQVGTFGNLNIAFFSNATTGTALTLDSFGLPNFSINGWAEGATVLNTINSTPGQVNSVTVLAGNGNAGSPVQFEVVAWTGTATTFAQAEANALAGTALIGFSGSALSGGALGWTQATGTPTSPALLVVGATGYNGMVMSTVPEPSTIALGGLAAASLLAFRRRK
jgi:hypothetical protein